MEFRRRGSGAHGLADVAAGLNDAYVELHINARDALASIPLVREAGGLTNDFLEGDGLVLQLSLLVDQEFGGLSFPVAGFGDGLMEPAPERPSENEVDAELSWKRAMRRRISGMLKAMNAPDPPPPFGRRG